MNDLVIMKDQQAVTSSLQVAKTFGKEHYHVLEAIESKISSPENSGQYQNMFADYEQWSDEDNEHVHMLLKWTPKGRKLIYDKLSEYGIATQLELLSNTNKKGEN